MSDADIDKWNALGEEYWLNRDTKQKWAHYYVLFPEILKIMQSIAPYSVLDYGCGDGALLNYLDNNFSLHNIYGFDRSEKLLQAAKLKYPRLNFIDNLENRSFDVICMNMVLQDVSAPAVLLNQLHTHLNNNGSIIITVPHPVFSLIERQHITTHREITNPSGAKDIYRYIHEETEHVYWSADSVTYTNLYNKTLTSYSRIFKNSGFYISEMFEPLAVNDGKSKIELYHLYTAVPKFLIFHIA